MARPERLGRIARASLATLLALPLAACIISTGLAQHAYDSADFDAALKLNPFSAEAKSAKAAALLAENRNSQAETLARAALDRAPLSADAAALLGYINEQRSGPAAAAPFMAAAAAMSWANETAQLWMLARATAAFDFEEAVRRTDGLLRQRIQRERMFTFLRGLTTYPAALDPLAGRLALRPKWRGDYMARLESASPEMLAAHGSLLRKLQATAAPPTRGEINAYVSRLIAAGLYAQARDSWFQFSGNRDESRFVRLNSPDEASPFEWVRSPLPGLSLAIESPSGAPNGSTLRVRADGRPSGRALERVRVSSPGSDVLVVEARANNPEMLQSLRWRLTCLGGNGNIELGSTRAMSLSDGWQRTEQPVTIPSGCPAQRLELQVDYDAYQDLDAWVRRVELRTAG